MLSAPDFEQKQIIFALLSRGEKLSFKNDNIVIKDQDGKIRHQSTCYRLFAVIIVGHASITSGLIQRAQKYGFTIILTTHGLSPYASFHAKADGNVLLRKKQYDYQSLEIAQHLIYNKIDQQMSALNRIRKKSSELKQAIKDLKGYRDRLPDDSHNLQEILGLEGIASRVYFKQIFAEHDWQGRKPRAKQDPTNTLLDIGYTLLFNVIECLLNLYGFDVYKGVYHQEFYQRKSLVCDIVEPFRPIIDYRIRKAYQLNQIHIDDFQIVQNQYRLFGEKAKPYTAFLLQAILEHKQQIFLYVQAYYRAFMRQKPIAEYPVFELEAKC
ncbi:hypothetical protein AVO42_04050 [Thiomicrospira sp. XS5]|uniref:type V CRISPR-associated endonuclease Cas1 n=1 Tax=Thiomicrospira sp. XS5 TaxID=1775636 RepID=UPI000749D09D|nr:type V CRISPR-associated endonuclease Cas1 [Thiomicrospira sp. XS5]KUJ74578.1 hypothetical protein AVO42_04050 [Thiomicrospira sp. XS5]